MIKSDEQNYYEVLDIPVDATPEQIKRAYRLAKKSLSERNIATYSLFDEDDREEMVAKIEEASQVLLTPELKRRYDKEVLGIEVETQNIQNLNGVSRDYEAMRADVSSSSVKGEDLLPAEAEKKVSSSSKGPKKQAKNTKLEKEISEATSFTGEFLKKVREYRGLTIDEISSITKISPDYIIAIESADVTALPPRVYLSGFLRNYAKVIKLEPQTVLKSYLQILDDMKHN